MASAIPRCVEWERIDLLPVRSRSDAEVNHLVTTMTTAFRTPHGTQTLLPLQAAALMDWAEAEGFCGWLPVGSGKTLVSFLAGNFFSHKRILLLQPAALVPKTLRALQEARQHWQISDKLLVLSYEKFQTVKGAELLETIAPDIIVCDEARAFRNPKAARTRRFIRYVSSRPHVRLMFLDGAIARRSIQDYWHLSSLALRGGSPLPTVRRVMEWWSKALDAGLDEFTRPAAGALRRWAPVDKCRLPDVAVAREGFRARTASTCGYMVTGDTVVAADLVVQERPLTPDAAMNATMSTIENTWETPNGDLIVQATDMRRHQRELACGFWYKWDPPPPEHWMEARRGWHKFVRETLNKEIPGIDSPMQVAQAFPNAPRLVSWRRVKDDYEIKVVPVWESLHVITDAARWLSETNGIAWVAHTAVGERLAAVSGCPYYGAGKRAAAEILTATGPIVASLAAHSKGKDLQRYHQNLVLTPMASGAAWEQLLGRTHRQGQEADVVQVDVYQHHECVLKPMATALEDSLFLEQTTGQPQRLLRAQKILKALDARADTWHEQ